MEIRGEAQMFLISQTNVKPTRLSSTSLTTYNERRTRLECSTSSELDHQVLTDRTDGACWNGDEATASLVDRADRVSFLPSSLTLLAPLDVGVGCTTLAMELS